ncbi:MULTISPECIES: ZIP family metal transporter [Adlercreutzia]|jgi:ZIP family zinc transporter|uniref:ZIP family metal transporter n=1 Tax=Adlercreutzia TaxID=447020 RepID=UPI0013C2FB04|nr:MULTISPECIES: ZIP family metal transporter [Adlercreutzia]MCB6759568.1 ZIP family metal transporter [Adlercreutzia equolifaciens]MCB6975298.1 ZIP family metal transporter [Adlercreutzia equolifaciens]MCP2076519.1 zinc transporter, ZIP family [Adlercreutzia equolifaciens subsp. celatus DSM 18785]MDE8683714.1 ZIP family metal transporter [Adlercreutzia rubneri]MEE0477253.1 ZIP family metal transporter [Adlercreutzia sp.]
METLSPFAFVTLVTLISGAGGTGLGGLIGALFKSESNRTISLLLAFAGGVMTAMVCFDLLAEAEEAASQVTEHGVLLVILAVALGVAVVYLLNHLIDRKTRKEVSHTADADHPETHDDIDELVHADHLNMHKRHHDSKLSLFVAGVVMACAIALHNIPEGMTIGASFAVSSDLMWGTGMIMAVLIGLHNIPEGMAVAVPLISGGTGRVRATLLTAACGLPTVLGAWLGFWLGDIGPLGLTMSLGFASGAMLYVVFGEIMPESYLIYRSKLPAFAVMVGLALGMFMIFF